MASSLEQKLKRRMPKALSLAIKFQGVVFRNVGQYYANQSDILSTTGSYLWGGRYNIATAFGVLYLSCDLHTCLGELEYAARYEGVNVEMKLPRTITGIRLELEKVLDLTDAKVRRMLGVSRKLLRDTDWAKVNKAGDEAETQIIGRIAKEAGFEAVLVPSARWSGKNLNLLDDGRLPSRAFVIGISLLEPKRRVRKGRRVR